MSEGGNNTQVGTCKWFNVLKGYGFITPDAGGEDVFVHQVGIHHVEITLCLLVEDGNNVQILTISNFFFVFLMFFSVRAAHGGLSKPGCG